MVFLPNAFIACCGADCQPHIHLFACSAWLLMPPPPHSIDIVPSQPPALTPAQLQDPYNTKLEM